MTEDDNHFVDEAVFAKVVTLPSGEDGLMIYGEVIEVRGCRENIADLLASALRRRGHESCALSGSARVQGEVAWLGNDHRAALQNAEADA